MSIESNAQPIDDEVHMTCAFYILQEAAHLTPSIIAVGRSVYMKQLK